MIRKILLRNEKKLYWEKGDLHTASGVIKEEDLDRATNTVKTHAGKDFIVYNANFLDQLKNCKRGPQSLTLKDLGQILIRSSVDKDSLVIDAGTGSGLLAAVMAKHAKKVISYDINPDHINLAKKNLEFLGIENIEVKEGDVYKNIDEKNADILILDLPEPWHVDTSCIKNGGTIIIYLPTITQVMEFCRQAKDHIEQVIELFEREWYVEGLRVRPKSEMLGHTAFLIILRKI